MPIAPFLNFHGIGHIGVYLFFVLSGFLLTRNLLAKHEKKGAVTTYLVRRFFRIVPLYFAVLIVVYLFQVNGYYSARYLHIDGGAIGLVRHMLFVQGDGVFWTLAAEFNFYLLLPLVVWIGIRFGVAWIIFGAVSYFVWFGYILLGGTALPAPKFVEIQHASQFLDVFACGVVAAFVKRKVPAGFAALVFIGSLVVSFACIAKSFMGFQQPHYGLRWFSLGYGLVFALVVVSATQGNRFLNSLFGFPILRFMGIVGFSWYLLHLQILQVVDSEINAGTLARFAIASIATAAASWAAYVAIEKPGMRLGRMLENKLRQRLAAGLLKRHAQHS